MRVRPNLSMCVHAEKSQKISTNVTIHSGLIYGPQRPRTWLSGLFLCKLWHLRLTLRAIYMFWLNICPVMLVEGTSDSHQPNRVYFAISLCLVFILIIKSSNVDWVGNSFLRTGAVFHANHPAGTETLVSKITSKKPNYSFLPKYCHC